MAVPMKAGRPREKNICLYRGARVAWGNCEACKCIIHRKVDRNNKQVSTYITAFDNRNQVERTDVRGAAEEEARGTEPNDLRGGEDAEESHHWILRGDDNVYL